jgi:hypothetical protein
MYIHIRIHSAHMNTQTKKYIHRKLDNQFKLKEVVMHEEENARKVHIHAQNARK